MILARGLAESLRPEATVVDLSELRLLSTVRLSVRYQTHRHAAGAGVRLRIMTGIDGRRSPAARILRITGLHSVLDVYPSVAAATTCLPTVGDL